MIALLLVLFMPPQEMSNPTLHKSTYGMLSAAPGLTILWQSDKEVGRTNLSGVLDVVIERFQYEQGTEGLASDSKARALVLVLQARAELEGKRTHTEDGTPIIE